MRPRRDELVRQVGELVVQQLRGTAVDQVRRRVAAWRDPRAQLLRKRRKAARACRFRGWMTAIGGGTTTIMAIAEAPVFLSAGAGAATALVAAAAVSAGIRSRQLNRIPLPEGIPPPPPRLPPHGSVAREPMRRLEVAEASLAELLRQLSTVSCGGLPPVPVDSVAHARATAAEAAGALRSVASQVYAIELARDAAPLLERGGLIEDIRRLRHELDEGVDGYSRLVAAAGRTLAASAGVGRQEALVDATDRLAGLAIALREIAGHADPTT